MKNKTPKQIGDKGENIAVNYLKNHGYTILCQNFRVPGGEVDIIAQKNNTIIFIEVKYRKNDNHIHPLELFNKQKIISFNRAIFTYLEKNNIDEENCRVDFIGILTKKSSYELTHIRGIELENIE